MRDDVRDLWGKSREHGEELAAMRTELAAIKNDTAATREDVRVLREQLASHTPEPTSKKRGNVTLPWWAVLSLILAGAICATPAALAGVLDWLVTHATQAGQ